MEIKFRIWNKFANNWIRNEKEEIQYFNLWTWADYASGLGWVHGADAFIFQQFTGLKDRSSEIYDGDILQGFDEMGSEIKGSVYMEEGQWRFAKKITKMRNYAIVDSWKNETQIIGNIFENPELLDN